MLVLLDRDGVINHDTPTGITQIADFELIAGSAEAIAKLNAAGAKVAVVTNQSVVGKGVIAPEQLQAIHAHMQAQLAAKHAHVDAIYACHDHPNHPTHRRKPAAGMLQEALTDFASPASKTPMVGDALRDLQAANRAGCPAHLVLTGKGAHTQQDPAFATLNVAATHDNLLGFVNKWLHPHANRA